MINFIKIEINRTRKYYRNINFLEDIYKLYKTYEQYLNDDYSNKDLLENIIQTIEFSTPFFWVILNDNEFAGFVFLENFIGSRENLYSAEVTTCFKPEFWGDFTKKVARKFVRYCFKKLNFKKLKAKVFKQNYRASAILKAAGM